MRWTRGMPGAARMGMQARLMSQALRKLSGAIKQTNTAVVFTNQLRQKIGVMFGNPETTTGGMALKFYASGRLGGRGGGGLARGGGGLGGAGPPPVRRLRRSGKMARGSHGQGNPQRKERIGSADGGRSVQ